MDLILNLHSKINNVFQLQIQFAVMVIHTSQALLPSCQPQMKPLAYMYMSNVVIIFYMFWDFYKKAYISKRAV